MKKAFGLILAILTLILPITANAAWSGSYIISSKADLSTTEGKLEYSDDGRYAYAYIGIKVNSGTVSNFDAILTLKNLTYVGESLQTGWTGTIAESGADATKVNAKLNSSTAKGTGSHLIAKLTFEVIQTGVECSVTMAKNESYTCEFRDNVYYGKNGDVVTEAEYKQQCATPICKVENGNYYGKDGNVVTKEQFEIDCPTENPKTGNFLPYAVVIIGIALAGGVYSVTRKKSKIYNV